MEKQPELPTCVGKESPRSGACIKKKAKPVCTGNKMDDDDKEKPVAE